MANGSFTFNWKILFFIVLPVLFCSGLWFFDAVSNIGLEYTVPTFTLIPQLETNYLYLYIHLFTIIPILLLSFDRRVHFHTYWKKLFPAILTIAGLFIVWDVIFTQMGVWGFNHDYHLTASFLGLPLEEWLFFITVPFACIFIYECLNYYVTKDVLAPLDTIISIGTAVVLLGLGFYHLEKLYTATTFILTGSFLLFHYLNFENTYRSRFYLAYLVSWIPFMLVDGALTGGFTKEPIVLYHPEEFLGIRIGSVPFEDSIYSLLMLMSIVAIFEWSKQKKDSKQNLSTKTIAKQKNVPISV